MTRSALILPLSTVNSNNIKCCIRYFHSPHSSIDTARIEKDKRLKYRHLFAGHIYGAHLFVICAARRPAHASGELLRDAAHRRGDEDPILRGRSPRRTRPPAAQGLQRIPQLRRHLHGEEKFHKLFNNLSYACRADRFLRRSIRTYRICASSRISFPRKLWPDLPTMYFWMLGCFITSNFHLDLQVVLIAIFVVFFKTEMKRTKADRATVASSSGSSGGEVATSQTTSTKGQRGSREAEDGDNDDLEGGALLEDKQ